jgi:hypothetical protein
MPNNDHLQPSLDITVPELTAVPKTSSYGRVVIGQVVRTDTVQPTLFDPPTIPTIPTVLQPHRREIDPALWIDDDIRARGLVALNELQTRMGRNGQDPGSDR